MNIELTENQKEAIAKINEWFHSKYSYNILKVVGYAGTGKTTIAAKFALDLHKTNKKLRIFFTSYTGRAVVVLNEKLNKFANTDNIEVFTDYSITVGTIHSLVYKPAYKKIMNEKGEYVYVITGWEPRDINSSIFDLIIVDEASMLNEEILRELKRFGEKILLFGDDFQLPPISGESNILKTPDIKLTEIVRVSENSDILKVSENLRKYGELIIPKNSNQVRVFEWNKEFEEKFYKINFMNIDNCILCAFNKFRVLLNRKIRESFGFDEDIIYPGEKIICLKNKELFKNGQIAQVLRCSIWDEKLFKVNLVTDFYEDKIELIISRDCFNKEKLIIKDESSYKKKEDEEYKNIYYFDFGYAISVHKSQGSEFKNVILFNQKSHMWDEKYILRWLYTGITRAKEKLIIINNI